MTKHLCWEPDYEDEDCALAIDAHDAEYAAQMACERWEKRGRWAGDPMPDGIDVRVRAEDGSLHDVSVSVSYSVDFYASKTTPVKAGREKGGDA